ncbi:hypothetical protein [Pseudomonas cerasi]
MNENRIRLTQYRHGGGCGCKMSLAVRDRILRSGQPLCNHPHLLSISLTSIGELLTAQAGRAVIEVKP